MCHSQWSDLLAVGAITKHSNLFQFSRSFLWEEKSERLFLEKKSLSMKKIEKINENLRFHCITAKYKCLNSACLFNLLSFFSHQNEIHSAFMVVILLRRSTAPTTSSSVIATMMTLSSLRKNDSMITSRWKLWMKSMQLPKKYSQFQLRRRCLRKPNWVWSRKKELTVWLS